MAEFNSLVLFNFIASENVQCLLIGAALPATVASDSDRLANVLGEDYVSLFNHVRDEQPRVLG